MINLSRQRNLIPILVLSLMGIVVSLYLTYNYFDTGSSAFCITGQDCEIVKGSKYSSILGIPVALLGVIGYLAISLTTISTITKRKKWLTLFVLSTAGVAFSAYLTYLEFFKINAICSYCIVSAVLMLLILGFILSIIDSMHPKSSMLNLLVTAVAIFGLVFMISYSIHSSSAENNLGASNEFQTGLAKHLGGLGATMYGSFKCPHCNEQKELFGEAFSNIRYVECHNRGDNANPSLCLAKGIRRYPTWEIEGKFYEGLIPLRELAVISDFDNNEPAK